MAEPGAIWRWLLDAFDAHQSAVLLIVTESRGSTPRKVGAKMALTASECIGTIGGGLIEAETIAIARRMLADGEATPKICRRAHHPSDNIAPSGMICGGEQTVLIYPCSSNDRQAFERLLASCRSSVPLNWCVSARGMKLAPAADFVSGEFVDGENWLYRETIGQCKRAYIIGAGHVGLALSKVLTMLDFDISVIDEREPLDSLPLGNGVQHKKRLSYVDIAGHIPEGSDVFVFIMTPDHYTDELVLSKLAGKRFAYLGLLGSRHKIAQLKQRLSHTLPQHYWQDIHAPMGVSINSHTPEEIAVSIAAEVIQIVNAH